MGESGPSGGRTDCVAAPTVGVDLTRHRNPVESGPLEGSAHHAYTPTRPLEQVKRVEVV